MAGLRERIRASGLTVHEYQSIDDFGRKVRDDMMALINRLYPPSEVVDPLARATAAHTTFAQRLSAIYERRDADFESLDAHVEGSGPPLVLIGESGIGKSALLANWVDRRRDLTARRAGAGPLSRCFVRELGLEGPDVAHHARAQAEAGASGATFRPIDEKLRPAFAEFLYAAGDKQRVVLILDGLDKLEDQDNAPDLLWLPTTPAGRRSGHPLDAARPIAQRTSESAVADPGARAPRPGSAPFARRHLPGSLPKTFERAATGAHHRG